MSDKSQKQPRKADNDGRSARQNRLRSAVDGAHDYGAHDCGASPEMAGKPGEGHVKPMEEWHDIVSQRIEDAMRQGLFDGLAGEGKPLSLDRDPFLPEDQQMAVTLLRNNGLAPEWISERKAILAEIATVREELRLKATETQRAFVAAQSRERQDQLREKWTVWLAGWETRLRKLNDRILVCNLKQPVSHLEIYQLLLTDELARAGTGLGGRPDFVA